MEGTSSVMCIVNRKKPWSPCVSNKVGVVRTDALAACECACIQYGFTGSAACSFMSPHQGLPSACMCVYLCGCVWESEREVYLLSAKRRACERCEPLSSSLCDPFVWASACQAARECVCVHSGAHVYDWGRERSCQVRLCQWPHKATEGHWSSQFLCRECRKKKSLGFETELRANQGPSLGAGKYRN